MPANSQPRSRSEYAYQQFRDHLLDGGCQAGQELSAASLAQKLGVNRTALMEVLKRLEAEGYLEIVPQVGCVVRGASAQQIRELLVHAAIESIAAELAAQRLDEQSLRLLKDKLALAAEAIERNDISAFQELN